MNKNQLVLLDRYIKANVSPILIENVPTKIFENSVVLESGCSRDLLNGHYENIEFVGPSWYYKLIEVSKKTRPILVIENINSIPKEEQTKFMEILKYKKISTFALPEECIIIVTATNLENNPINEEVYSLMAHILGS